MLVSDMNKQPPKAELAVADIELIVKGLEIQTDPGYEAGAEALKRVKHWMKRLKVAEGFLKEKLIGYQLLLEKGEDPGLPEPGQAPPPIPKRSAPKVKGVSTSSKWKISEVQDLEEFCFWLMENRPGEGYVLFDSKKVEKLLNRLDGQVVWPGVVVEEIHTMRVRSEDDE